MLIFCYVALPFFPSPSATSLELDSRERGQWCVVSDVYLLKAGEDGLHLDLGLFPTLAVHLRML